MQAPIKMTLPLTLFAQTRTKLEDISTRDLIYFLAPYAHAQVRDRVKTVERDERLASLMPRSHDLFKEFFTQLDKYDLIPEDEVALYERKAANAATIPMKDLRAMIGTIRTRRNQHLVSSKDFDLISSLLPANVTATDDDNDSSHDTALLLIRLSYAQALAQLSNLDQELQLLKSAPPSIMSNSPQADDDGRRRKSKEDENNVIWKIDAPSKPKADGPLLNSSGKVYILSAPSTITILPFGTAADRARLQAQVLYLAADGWHYNKEEKVEMKRLKDERWATFTDENPRGAGNTMNRG
ncbi:hypothetical protein BT96DRAFT_959526 [Gymnopus androsaceus JB14]|uniref:Uncharacterized protein n=1 Tax=Gymnopus androsaceus JB14 TaxID=1447944 RepID=A0A6A4H0N2_9AGAR|nr:hypothetical protein BT96DRAFT_959526 [Gymnopus androsaceus JB14]